MGALLANLFKAFDCILRQLLIAKIAVIGWIIALYCLYTLTRKFSNSAFVQITLKVVLKCNFRSSPSLFNLSINDLFCIIEITSVYNFSDNNTLTAFAKTIPELTGILAF